MAYADIYGVDYGPRWTCANCGEPSGMMGHHAQGEFTCSARALGTGRLPEGYAWGGPGNELPVGHVAPDRLDDYKRDGAGRITEDREAMGAIVALQARGYTSEQVRSAWSLIGTCRVCGCTDNDCSQCIEATGHPCSWANGSNTLCTRCYLAARGGR